MSTDGKHIELSTTALSRYSRSACIFLVGSRLRNRIYFILYPIIEKGIFGFE